jgi:chemosensory pili system protein ChpA (sensor histidine kinase/response regulator)
MADVLIVDDDDDLAEITAMIIEGAGHHTRRAVDGCDGLERLHERLPDLLVLDVEMPQLSGPDMASQMRVRDAGMERVPILLVSGCVGLAAIAARVGTPYVLAKPYSIERFLAVLARALDERRAPTHDLTQAW